MMRQTDYLEKQDGDWKVLHEHTSTRAATKTANVYTRVDPDTKEQAEAIFNHLGIPVSNAIGIF